MKYPYIVNKNGVWYPAGAEVPEDAVKPTVNKSTEESPKDDFAQYTNPPEPSTVSYTKTDINRMSTAELKELAKSEGIDGAEDMTGGRLKEVLIEKFGL